MQAPLQIAPHPPDAPRPRAAAVRPLDLLLVPDGFLPASSLHGFPPYARFLAELGAIGRVILFERHGLGAPEPPSSTMTLADWVEDARRALDAARASAAVVIGIAEGAITAIALAARYPERIAGVVLLNATPGPSLTQLARCGLGPRYIEILRWCPERWVHETPGLEVVVPSLGRDERFTVWVRDAFLAVGGPRRLQPAFDLVFRADARPLLARVRAPTLVVHRRDDAWFSPEHGWVIARAIPEARYLELPGADHAPYLGDTAAIVDAISWFVRTIGPPEAERAPQDSEAPPSALTGRQAKVLELVAAGLTDKQVSAQLGLSTRTVQKHLERAYRRLGVQNRTAAARLLSDAPPPPADGQP